MLINGICSIFMIIFGIFIDIKLIISILIIVKIFRIKNDGIKMLNDFVIVGGIFLGIEIFNFLFFENFVSMVILIKVVMIVRNIFVEFVIFWVKMLLVLKVLLLIDIKCEDVGIKII